MLNKVLEYPLLEQVLVTLPPMWRKKFAPVGTEVWGVGLWAGIMPQPSPSLCPQFMNAVHAEILKYFKHRMPAKM
jgi:hypothetical protein